MAFGDLQTIVRAGIEGVDPTRLLVRAVAGPEWTDSTRLLRILSVGKAAFAMAAAAQATFADRIVAGLIVSPEPRASLPRFSLVVGDHPLPTIDSERAGHGALALARSVRPDERFLCLLSGGASALMVAPPPGISLADKKDTTNRLLRAGADIGAINTVRKHLSLIKGGGLARASSTGCHTFAISDVIGDDLSVIGSGPCVPDGTTFSDALDTLRRHGGLRSYPAAVTQHLVAGSKGMRAETLKATDPEAALATASVIGGRMEAMNAACAAATRLGYDAMRLDEPVVGEARVAGRFLARKIRSLCVGPPRPVCIVSSGETTVHVTGTGRGGRSQELALSAVPELQALGRDFAMASVGTDGIDGPTDAAGACVDHTTMSRAERLGLCPEKFMEANNSYEFFRAIGNLWVTGYTGTNVGDLQVFLSR